MLIENKVIKTLIDSTELKKVELFSENEETK